MKFKTTFRSLHILIYIIIIIFFNSCTKKVDTHKKKFFVSDSLIYKNNNSDELFSGVVTDTVNGQIVSYEVKDGMKNGFFKIKSIKDSLIMTGTILNNKNSGEWRYYYENGVLESKGFFKNDLPDSVWTWYYPDGSLKEKGSFAAGSRIGIGIVTIKMAK